VPLGITLAIQAMVAMSLLALPVMAPEVTRALQVSPSWVGAYMSLGYIGAIAGSLLGGSACRRWGAIRVSQAGLVVCALGLLLCAVPWLPVMALGALLIGLGYGPITPASSHVLARTTPAHRRSLVFSIKQTGVPVGSMLAGATVPSVMLALNWHAGMVMVALCLAPTAAVPSTYHTMDPVGFLNSGAAVPRATRICPDEPFAVVASVPVLL
jgi:MFS family permease